MTSVRRDSSLSQQDRTQNQLIRKEITMNNVERRLQPQVANLSPPPHTLPRRSFLRRMGLGAVALAPGAALLSSASKTFGDEEESQTGSRRRQRYSRPIFGSNTTNSAASKTAKSQGEVAIQTILRPWRLLRMKWETISMTTPMMKSLITGF